MAAPPASQKREKGGDDETGDVVNGAIRYVGSQLPNVSPIAQAYSVSMSSKHYQTTQISEAVAAQRTSAGLGLVLQKACALSHLYFVRAVGSRLHQHFDGSVLLSQLGFQFCDAYALQMCEK